MIPAAVCYNYMKMRTRSPSPTLGNISMIISKTTSSLIEMLFLAFLAVGLQPNIKIANPCDQCQSFVIWSVNLKLLKQL